MIGIVIIGQAADPEFDNKIFFRIQGKTVLEHTIDTCLSSPMAHRVVVCLPSSDVSLIHGGPFKEAVISSIYSGASNGIMSRLHFSYSDAKSEISRLYKACLDFDLDAIAIVDADCPLITSWIINDAITLFCRNNYVIKTLYQDGLNVTVYPFWVIASLQRYIDYPEKQEAFSQTVAVGTVNERIPTCKTDLRLKSRSQIPIFDAFIADAKNGIDIVDIIKEFNDE